MSPTTYTAQADVEQVAWRLSDLLDGYGPESDSTVVKVAEQAKAEAEAFAERYSGALTEIDGSGLLQAMDALASIYDLITRSGSYASLAFSTDTADPAIGALMQRVDEIGTEIETRLLFFELEWAKLEDDRVDDLLAADGMEPYRHYLRSARRYRDHLLTEPEEKILAEKNLSGRSAWMRLFEEQSSAITVDINGESVPLSTATAKLFSTDRSIRKQTSDAITEALNKDVRTRAYIYNTLLSDKATDDKLRRYPHWLASRNLANEASDESVQALIEAVQSRYDIPQRWYRLKAKLLEVDRLAHYDRMAPVSTLEVEFSWDESCAIVRDTYHSFSPKVGAVIDRFFDEGWIDAPVRPNKRGGAFCAYATPKVHPYVLLNFTAQRRDVLTLAHELGHGLHCYLAGPQGIFQMGTPLTLAETASVFGEELTFGRLVEQTTEKDSLLALMAEQVEGSIATVFRQVAMNRFEDAAHNERRNKGELSVNRFSELWLSTQRDLWGDSIEASDDYGAWWSYIPHFIGTPGYVYAYAYGQLFALSLYGRYQSEGSAFVDSYIELLSAGGSKSPGELSAIVGMDVTDPQFWTHGLDLIERQLVATEKVAEELSD